MHVSVTHMFRFLTCRNKIKEKIENQERKGVFVGIFCQAFTPHPLTPFHLHSEFSAK